MTPDEYQRGYRERLGRVLLNPFDLSAITDWLQWTTNNPFPVVSRGGAK